MPPDDFNPTNFNAAFQETLYRQSPPPLHDPAYIAHHVLRRDQRRTRLLAAASLTFWLLGAAGMAVLLVGLDRFVIGVRIDQLQPRPAAIGSANDAPPDAFAVRDPFLLDQTSLLHHAMPYAAAAVVSLLLAALFTVMLVFSSRQATLNRINVSLSRIAEQIAQMRPAGGPSTAPAPGGYSYGPTTFEPPAPRWGHKLAIVGLVLALGFAFAIVAARHHARVTAASAPSAAWQGYPRLAPFDAIRWHGEVPQIHVNNAWYDWEAIDDVPVYQLVAYAQTLGPSTWQKHVNEDLVELLTRLRRRPPGRAVTLVLRDAEGHVESIPDVEMTESNRRDVWLADEADAEARPATRP